MSRLTAGLGSALGMGVGLVAGNVIAEKTRSDALTGEVFGMLAGGALGAALGAGSPACPTAQKTGVGDAPTLTPAQASGHPNFVTDVPVQGPTDEGMRAADCWFAQNRLPAHPACVDCGGPIPMWAQSKGLLGEQVSFGGAGALGFTLDRAPVGIGAAGDPEVWGRLAPPQQMWVMSVLIMLDAKIREATKSTCGGGPITASTPLATATRCFQAWSNAQRQVPVTLRTDGVFDLDTLNALIATTQIHSKDFPVKFPGAVPTVEAKKKLSTGAMVGIAAAGATALGGIVYVATRKRGRRRRR